MCLVTRRVKGEACVRGEGRGAVKGAMPVGGKAGGVSGIQRSAAAVQVAIHRVDNRQVKVKRVRMAHRQSRVPIKRRTVLT